MSKRRNEVFNQSSSNVPTSNVMAETFGYEVPVESVPLASKGLLYPVTSPLHGKSIVDIRSMTAREEDLLTSQALLKQGTVITELIRSCIIDKSIKVDELIAGDRNAIMIAIRITGYGQEYQAEVTCQDCGEQYEGQFDLAALPIKNLEILPVEAGQNAFEFTLPVSKKKVIFKFLTGADESELMMIDKRRKKTGAVASNFITQRLSMAISQIDAITDRNAIATFVRNMPARDSRALRNFISENEPGVDMKGFTQCIHCSHEQEVTMPIGAQFFWPDA